MTKPHPSSVVEGNALSAGVAGQRPLPRSFYEPSAKAVAPQLLGHWLVRRTEQGLSGGIIVETEAYLVDDPACHGYKRETPRNRAMYGPPGHTYVYFIYGNHWCFNAVCRPTGVAEAVLVRAIEPLLGIEWMQQRRTVGKAADLTNGPAKFCAALDIGRAMDHVDLCSTDSPVFIAENADRTQLLKKLGPVVTTTRIGITQAADWPLRFYLDGSAFVSRRVRADATK
jgi:DNA-3-methyladenine glycosylase